MAEQSISGRKLPVGTKYLSIAILGQIKVAAFKNEKKKTATDPDYIGNGIAVWVNEKQPEKQQQADPL